MRPADLDKARELIKQAGAEGESVDVYTNNDENRPEIGQYLTDMLNKIGLKAELKVIDAGVYFQTVGNDKTKAAIGAHQLVPGLPASGQLPVPRRTARPTSRPTIRTSAGSTTPS